MKDLKALKDLGKANAKFIVNLFIFHSFIHISSHENKKASNPFYHKKYF